MNKVIHKLIVKDGKYIQLPPGMEGQEIVNLEIPDSFATSTVQKYPLGTRFVVGDRVYRYCKASGDVKPYWGAYKPKKSNAVVVAPTQSTVVQADGKLPGIVGSLFVSVTIDAEIGVLTTGVLAKDELAGGYVVVGNGVNQYPQIRLIVSHPALANTGGTLTIKLDMPLDVAVTAATTTIELIECPFYCVKADGLGNGYVSFIGIPQCVASSGEYFWVQTWGICWITSDGNTCDSVGDRTLVFAGNGSVVSSNDIIVENGFQIAGIAMDMSGSSASNAPFVLLQIMP